MVLAFFKVSCPVCQMAFPYLQRLHDQAQGAFRLVGISQDSVAHTREFCAHFGVRFPALVDHAAQRYPVSSQYGLASVPTLFVVEPDGVLSQVIEGWSRRDLEALAARAQQVLFTPADIVPDWKAG